MEKTFGGDRIGSGSKMKTELNSYGRSTHNLTETFKSTMAAGTLVPFYVNIGLKGDTFDINLDAFARTLPTMGPLFGSMKLQLDMYEVPLRLYNAILHNNPVNIGLQMNKVKLPKLHLYHDTIGDIVGSSDFDNSQIASNSLLKYLGISGIGMPEEQTQVEREFMAAGVLAYYDIFKNYYANKQEDNAYVIATEAEYDDNDIDINETLGCSYVQTKNEVKVYDLNIGANISIVTKTNPQYLRTMQDPFKGTKWTLDNCPYVRAYEEQNGVLTIYFSEAAQTISTIWIVFPENRVRRSFELKPFPLANIDKARMAILSKNDMNANEVLLNRDCAYYPYITLWGSDEYGKCESKYPMQGLCVKTYQSDLFNNWLNRESIDSENGIAEVTRVDVSDGLKLDALLLAKKVYNMMNQIVASGNTYEDWLEATSGEAAMRRAESPIYCGGMASEIVFEEVIGTAETAESKLGSLAGRGTLQGKRAGHVTIKVSEPSIIMGIVSITPRIAYSQGNSWFNTELDSLDDLHKAALDGIGFQNLMCDQMAWWSTTIEGSGNVAKKACGKVPAWLNYMTSVDKVFGEFAEKDKRQYMVLTRDYTPEYDPATEIVQIKDLTTYIDPQKFNYPFAYQELDAQNYWVQILTDVVCRRIMSAKMIPNL